MISSTNPMVRVGEVQRTIGFVDEIIGAIQTFALVTICENGELSVFFLPDNTAIPMLVDREPCFLIESEAVRPWLPILSDIKARVAALGHVDRELTVLCPAIDCVVVWIAEQKIAIAFF